MLACKGGHLSVAQFLLTQGADVNSKDDVRYVLCTKIISNDFMIIGFDMICFSNHCNSYDLKVVVYFFLPYKVFYMIKMEISYYLIIQRFFSGTAWTVIPYDGMSGRALRSSSTSGCSRGRFEYTE